MLYAHPCCGANVTEQAAGEPTAQNLGSHFQRRIIFVAQLAAQFSDVEKSLRGIVLRCQIKHPARPSPQLSETPARAAACTSNAEELFELGLQLGGGEIAIDFQRDVRREVITLVEIDHIVPLDVVDIGILNAPAIRRVAAVNDVAEFAVRDAVGIVIAA